MESTSVKDVSVTTATVDIAVIRVGAKQMTQAVFKQLPIGNPMQFLTWDTEQEYQLLPKVIPWGYVKHELKVSKTMSQLEWFIIQQSDKLYRVALRYDDALWEYSRVKRFINQFPEHPYYEDTKTHWITITADVSDGMYGAMLAYRDGENLPQLFIAV